MVASTAGSSVSTLLRCPPYLGNRLPPARGSGYGSLHQTTTVLEAITGVCKVIEDRGKVLYISKLLSGRGGPLAGSLCAPCHGLDDATGVPLAVGLFVTCRLSGNRETSGTLGADYPSEFHQPP